MHSRLSLRHERPLPIPVAHVPAPRPTDSDPAFFVGDVMTHYVIAIEPTTTVREAQRLMRAEGVGHLPVVCGGHVSGIVSRLDLQGAKRNGPVSRCMTSPALCIHPDVLLSEAAEVMRREDVGCLPVVEHDELLGILTRGDLRSSGWVLVDAQESTTICMACLRPEHLHYGPAGISLCLDCLERSQLDDEDDGQSEPPDPKEAA